MPIQRRLQRVPPPGYEYECDHVDDGDQSYTHGFGGGLQVSEVTLDTAALAPGDQFYFTITRNEPCKDCNHPCDFVVSLDSAGEYNLAESARCGNCNNAVTITLDGTTWVLTSLIEGQTFSVSVAPVEGSLVTPGLTVVNTVEAQPLGALGVIQLGVMVVQDPASEFYNPKTVMPPQGSTTEIPIGVSKFSFSQVQPDFDSCCACPVIGRCTRFCVKTKKKISVKLAEPLAALTPGSQYVVSYVSDPTSESNGYFYILDPAAAQPTDAVVLENYSFVIGDIGASFAVININ